MSVPLDYYFYDKDFYRGNLSIFPIYNVRYYPLLYDEMTFFSITYFVGFFPFYRYR